MSSVRVVQHSGVTQPDEVPVPSQRSTPAAAARARARARDAEAARRRELHAQHDRLRALFAALCTRIDPSAQQPVAPGWHRETLRLVDDLESLLAAHFAWEEAGGYLSDALAAAPRLRDRVERLLREHREVSARFARFARLARAAGPSSGWDHLVDELRELVEAVDDHELEENRLVQEAFLDDLGGGS